ncbi:MAG: ferrous iron transport protein B, partial [Lachnospiraceae bacterium]|nr:ferrous iron transport protein B [Lachnospiraceae bacterium]
MSITIALAGNPNSGKTTLFNALTGSNQFVGNWPGVTVEKKEGRLKGQKDVTVMDLPGIYSLSPYTLEEVVARNYLIDERPDAILNIVDGTNIERNLYLTTQLMELGIPVVMAVNMLDLMEKHGDKVDTKKLGEKLGCEVVEISALKGKGIKEAANRAIEIAKKGKALEVVHEFSADAEEIISKAEDKITGVAESQKRFFAIKLLERDDKIADKMRGGVPDVSAEIKELEDAFDDDAESIITNERYTYISSIIGECVKKGRAGAETVSDKIDKIVTNRILGLPIFAAVMFLVYWVSVSTVGTWATDWANDGLLGDDGWNFLGIEKLHIPGLHAAVGDFLEAIHCADWLTGLINDGIVAGVGAVLGFVPQILILFIFLAVLESCGYMARVAFIMDRLFRKFGLSGKSFIPMLIGSGCGIPGVMASRTIESDRDRKMTIMTTTVGPCGAKMPILGLIAGAFFNESGWVATSA